MKKGYRIISIEAADIYRHEQENGVSTGYKLPKLISDAYFRLFKIYLDYSLDLIELEKAYKRICRKKFSFQDESENEYTLAVINVKFNYTYKPQNGKPIKIKELREHFYENGFYLDGVHYVRYKRSAGSSREGKCLFIDERLYKAMSKWSSCGLKAQTDLASWESYMALSLSSIKGTIVIPLDGILFVPDYKSTFKEEVISVELQDGNLTAEQKQTQITNDIWDGESLLDESVFTDNYADKHMLLLRNKFFKSCAFRTKLQKWIQDKNITLDDLKARGFVTLATDVSQIVMVTTPNSLKYLKFAGGLTEKNIRKWIESVDNTFGVVKWDKSTRFFHGDMVQSSYQLLNTLGIDKAQAEELLKPSFDYISLIRNDVEFMRYHFTDAYAREKDGEEKKVPDGLAERAEVIFCLLMSYTTFDSTALYANFRDDVVSGLKGNLRRGHILLNGTNATLFGNGPELLKYIAGEEVTSELKKGQIYSKRFENGAKLLCARSPHITMGNLYFVENNLDGGIWDYFDLGNNIVCVNAIGENIQQRLNGCDYDSDTMLVTDDKLLVETAEKYKGFFKVPVCEIETAGKTDQTLAELDHDTSENKIGEIVNLSQKLNSIIWSEIVHGAPVGKILEIYNDVCKLAVLSGLEIDKAKRAFDNVNVGKELSVLRKKYNRPVPMFFKEIDERDKENEYEFYDTAMDYIYQAVKKFNFQKGKKKRVNYTPISWTIIDKTASDNATDYRHRDKIIEICDECKRGCHLTKKYYVAADAQSEYYKLLSESRKGFLISEAEASRLNKLVQPLVEQGHSIHHICATYKDEIMLNEKTIYAYIDNGVLDVKNIDLPRKVRYRLRKKPKEFKVDKACRINRTYDDYLEFLRENDYPSVVQMDSVKGSQTGAVLLTIYFVSTGFMLAYLREANTSKSVTDVFNNLYDVLGRDVFMRMFPVILTDNGSEFSDPMKIEFDENGERRTYVFYCNQNRSDQKGNIEVNHEFIRRISPKGIPFDTRTQEDINLMMSHINSYKRKRLNDRSPYSVFSLF